MVVNNVEIVSIFAGTIYEDTHYVSVNKWKPTKRPVITKKPSPQESIKEDTCNISRKTTPPKTPPKILKKPNAKQIFR